jgi:hypothetical protein
MILSGAALAALLVSVMLFVVARIRRFGEMTKTDTTIRWVGVVLWFVLICGGWGLFCVESIFLLRHF